MSKKALGRGIEALLRGEEVKGEAGTVRLVPVSALSAGEHQPRRHFRPEALAELADSVRQKGVLQPILVERVGEASYRIVAGERRFRAAQLAGLGEVPVLVRSFTEAERLEVALIENVQREDLSPMEEAAAYQQLIALSGLSQDELARRVGKKRSTVTNALRLLKLPAAMQGSVDRGEMSAGHARAILSLVNPADQEVLHRRILAGGLSVREAEAQAARLGQGNRSERKGGRPKPSGTRVPELKELEQKLIERLGTKVVFKGSAQRGRIEIEYFSGDDLERIFTQLDRG